MGRFVQSAGFGMGVTSALILAYLFFVDRRTSYTKPLRIVLEDKRAVNKDREQESLPNDNPDLVFLRKYGRVKNIPSPPEMRNMSDKELFYIYHSYLDNTDYHCRRKLRMGHAGDGGWEVCDDFRYRPIKPCIVYSFGINYDFSFDDDVSKIYGCVVHSFDPSMNQQSHQRLTQGWFYNLGIGGEDGRLPTEGVGSRGHNNWSVKTLAEIMAMLRHQNMTIDVLKMDVEFSEWPALEQVSQRELSQVRQFLVEFHYLYQKVDVRKKLAVLYKLESNGFRRFYTHVNPAGPRQQIFLNDRKPCYEIGFVNSNLPRKV